MKAARIRWTAFGWMMWVGLALGLIGVWAASPARGQPETVPAERELIWGVNGHPFSAYPDISWADQLDLVRTVGASQYRVNFRPDDTVEELEKLARLADEYGVTILPVIVSYSYANENPSTIYRRAFERARDVSSRLRGRFPVWELGNEEEIYAIIRPCERYADGGVYSCAWGPAPGTTIREYVPERWARISAFLKGLSEGLRAGDPQARRAIGTSGWGRVAPLELLRRDGVSWDITVWHEYTRDPAAGPRDEVFEALAQFGKPIWITEFTAGGLDLSIDVNRQARIFSGLFDVYRQMAPRYNIEAAFIYELLDQPYLGDGTFEARMGLVRVEEKRGGGWTLGARKPSFFAAQRAWRTNATRAQLE